MNDKNLTSLNCLPCREWFCWKNWLQVLCTNSFRHEPLEPFQLLPRPLLVYLEVVPPKPEVRSLESWKEFGTESCKTGLRLRLRTSLVKSFKDKSDSDLGAFKLFVRKEDSEGSRTIMLINAKQKVPFVVNQRESSRLAKRPCNWAKTWFITI